jgi:Skp family chaperone for outer membrane proteins
MNNKVITISISLLAGVAAAAIVLTAREPQTTVAVAGAGDYFDQSAATDERLRALELAVAQERNARQLLEEELLALYGELERLDRDSEVESEETAAAIEQQRESFRERAGRFRTETSAQSRVEQLVNSGFSPDRAEWIVKRESELQLAAMQAVFEARQSGEPIDRFDARMNPDNALRAEIGDLEYEQYLEANGRSTSVAVGTVLESSPGQRAGLQAGDAIVAYGGQRVFSYAELSEQTMNAQAGQSVVVDIVRDGMPMQVVVEAGPIGISNRGFPGRR